MLRLGSTLRRRRIPSILGVYIWGLHEPFCDVNRYCVLACSGFLWSRCEFKGNDVAWDSVSLCSQVCFVWCTMCTAAIVTFPLRLVCSAQTGADIFLDGTWRHGILKIHDRSKCVIEKRSPYPTHQNLSNNVRTLSSIVSPPSWPLWAALLWKKKQFGRSSSGRKITLQSVAEKCVHCPRCGQTSGDHHILDTTSARQIASVRVGHWCYATRLMTGTCVVPISLASRCVIYHNNRAAIGISCYCSGVVRRADWWPVTAFGLIGQRRQQILRCSSLGLFTLQLKVLTIVLESWHREFVHFVTPDIWP